MYESREDAAAAERAALEFTDLEAAQSEHERYKARRGNQEACRLSTDHDIPRSNASGAEWTAWHESRTQGPGGYDPCSLIRPNQ